MFPLVILLSWLYFNWNIKTRYQDPNEMPSSNFKYSSLEVNEQTLLTVVTVPVTQRLYHKKISLA